MKVKVIQNGYFNHKRRYVGEILVLNDEKEFSKVWMKKVDGRQPVVADPSPDVVYDEDEDVI